MRQQFFEEMRLHRKGRFVNQAWKKDEQQHVGVDLSDTVYVVVAVPGM